MIQIVPVEEFIILSKPGINSKADPELYGMFRDRFFLKKFNKTLTKSQQSQLSKLKGSKVFDFYLQIKGIDQRLGKFDRKRKKIIFFEGNYYCYSIKQLNWFAIELIRFDSENEALDFYNRNSKLWKIIHVLLPFTKGIENV